VLRFRLITISPLQDETYRFVSHEMTGVSSFNKAAAVMGGNNTSANNSREELTHFLADANCMNNKSDLRILYDPTTECASYVCSNEKTLMEWNLGFGFGDWLDTAARRTRPLGS